MTAPLLQLLKPGSIHQLVFFPYLGGHAGAYLALANRFSDEYAVWGITLPGRRGDVQQPSRDLAACIQAVVEQLVEAAVFSPCFYGHSMGGVLAYCVAEYVQQHPAIGITLKKLILSGCEAPCDFLDRENSRLSDENLLVKVGALSDADHVDPAVEACLHFLLPVYRADFALLEASAQRPYQRLLVETSYFYGDQDRVVDFSAVSRWLPYIAGEFALEEIRGGGHMFIDSHPDSVVAKVVAQLDRSTSQQVD